MVSRALGNNQWNIWKKNFQFAPKREKKRKVRKTRKAIAKLFALHANPKREKGVYLRRMKAFG